MTMRTLTLTTLAASLLLSGCASTGAWMGAAAEKAYDKDLEIRRLAEVANNDDYYELERDGRIYVVTDASDFRNLRTLGELAYSTKLIGAGPGGRTVVYGLIKTETKRLEKDPRAQGAAQKMFEGKLAGMERNFFGLVERDEATYVFSSWKDLQAFKAAGSASGFAETPPGGPRVIYASAAERPAELAARVARLYAP